MSIKTFIPLRHTAPALRTGRSPCPHAYGPPSASSRRRSFARPPHRSQPVSACVRSSVRIVPTPLLCPLSAAPAALPPLRKRRAPFRSVLPPGKSILIYCAKIPLRALPTRSASPPFLRPIRTCPPRSLLFRTAARDAPRRGAECRCLMKFGNFYNTFLKNRFF